MIVRSHIAIVLWCFVGMLYGKFSDDGSSVSAQREVVEREANIVAKRHEVELAEREANRQAAEVKEGTTNSGLTYWWD